jgi:hypothetical protein
MFFVAAMLAILSGLFYPAGRHEIGSLGVAMCQYGSPFCDNPLLVLVAAGLAARWGGFVSVRRRARLKPASFCDDAVMPVICPTCQRRALPRRRRINRVNGLRYEWLRLHLQLRLGRHDLCAGCPGSLAGGTVIRDHGRLYLRLIP